jgi:hypothetical protein
MASLDTGAARSVSVRWRNGFEALASLDTNGDGEVSGPELAPLALWFDVNRDGVSQPGEVRAVTREGVTKLFYTVDHSENEGRHLYASRGFERVTKEGRKLGRAVDWFAEGDTNRMLLAQKLISQPSVLGGEAADSVVRQLKEDLMTRVVSDGDAEVYASTQADPDLRGLWEWQIETTDDSKRNGFEPKGYLGFSTESDGRISGYSVVELPFMDGHPTKSMARAYIIEGRRTSKDQFSFDLQMPTSTSTKLHNTVKRISPHRLEGRTTVTVLEKGGTATVDYTWTAQQVLRK